MKTNGTNTEAFNRIIIGNMSSMLLQLEDRITQLEFVIDKKTVDAVRERQRNAAASTRDGFDLEAYRKRLEAKINKLQDSNNVAGAEAESDVAAIMAYAHALSLTEKL